VSTTQSHGKHFDQTQIRIQQRDKGRGMTQKSYEMTSQVRKNTQAKTHRKKPHEKTMSTPTRAEESGRERVRDQDRG